MCIGMLQSAGSQHETGGYGTVLDGGSSRQVILGYAIWRVGSSRRTGGSLLDIFCLHLTSVTDAKVEIAIDISFQVLVSDCHIPPEGLCYCFR